MHKALLLLKKIPKGKVTTYKELAKAANSSPRAIGQVMRNNSDPVSCPCYKVVRSDGSLGGYMGKTKGKAMEKKIILLRKDGIKVGKNHIDISRYLYKFQ